MADENEQGEEESTDGGRLSAYILVRMTPVMKKELEDKVYWDRTKIPILIRDWIEQYTSEPSINQKTEM